MILLITGASGFLGQTLVQEALHQGHRVRAVVRDRAKATQLPWSQHPNLDLWSLDLCQDDLGPALTGIDAVIHAAAAKTGDYATQYANTVTVTARLLTAMAIASVQRLVLVSSFSVYNYASLPEQATLNEATPLEAHPQDRDIYAQMKLQQEAQVQAFAAQGGQVTIVRPGMIYSDQVRWHALLGIRASLRGSDRLWVCIDTQAPLPLIHVTNCATAIVAALQPSAIGATVNLVDDHLPTPTEYVQAILPQLPQKPIVINLPWPWLARLSQVIWTLNQSLGSRFKLPGLLIPARLQARFKPLRYSNQQAKTLLDWTPKQAFPAP